MITPGVDPRALFRAEVLAPWQGRLHGDLLLTHAACSRWSVALLAPPCAALLCFLAFGSYVRTASISGTLVPAEGLLHIASTQPGLVIERRVSEGSVVAADAVLFGLQSERASATRGNAEQAIGALMASRRASLEAERQRLARQAQLREADARRQQQRWREELQRIAAQRDLQQQRVRLAESAAQRYTALQARGFVPTAEVQQREADLLDQRQREAELASNEAALLQTRQAAAQQQREQQWQSEHDSAALERELALLEENSADSEARRAWLVRAPRAGTVSAVLAEPGQNVTAGQTLAALSPQQALIEAELYAPSRAAGFLRPGLAVRLRYQAYAYQKFGLQAGHIREISASALPVDGHGEPMYRVRVVLERQSVRVYGVDRPLQAGAAVDASVLLEQRHLYEWLLDPLYSLRGRV
jgi:membrane fusion protein